MNRRAVEGGGILGFGCGFIVIAAGGVFIFQVDDIPELVVVAAVAVVFGVFAAKYGDSLIAWVIERLRWL